jgi:hypothetical protein
VAYLGNHLRIRRVVIRYWINSRAGIQ